MGPVSVISVLFRSKRPGDRSFSLVAMCLLYPNGSGAKTFKNVSFAADWSNGALQEHLGTRFGYLCVVSVKTTRGSLLFTCYDVFDVTGWFRCENLKKCEFCCTLVKRGSSGPVSVISVLFPPKRPGDRSFSLVAMCLM